MKKYLLYRDRPEDADEEQCAELIAVEHGTDIDDVLDELISAIQDDVGETPEFKHCDCDVYPPELERRDPVTANGEYSIVAAVEPPSAPENILVDYTVFEEDEAQQRVIDGQPDRRCLY